MKKLLAIALASVMAFSTPLTVSAEEIVVSDGVFEAEDDVQEQSNANAEDVTGAVYTDVPSGQGGEVSPAGREALQEKYRVDFEMTSAMMIEKAELTSVLDDLAKVTPGKDYIDGQVVVRAKSKAEAQKIADGFGGTLMSCQDGIAVVETELSTMEAVALAADQDIHLPAAYPNYFYTLDDAKYWAIDKENAAEIGTDIKVLKEAPSKPEEVKKAVDPVPIEAETKSVIEAVIGGDARTTVSDPEISRQWYHETIDTFTAWDTASKMGEGVTVAIIDSGIDKDHPEFAGRVTAVNKVTTSPLNGADDNLGHGTHVAGIIGAAAGNNIGGAGIAPKVNILSLKALDAEREGIREGGTTADIVRAMIYAMGDSSVRVMNMSLGGPSGVMDILYQEAVDEAVKRGIVVIAAAGNDGWDISKGEYKSSPACLDGVVSVASLDKDGKLSNFSNYGKVEISAPGGSASDLRKDENGVVWGAYDERDIFSTYPGGFAYMAGTSMACPVVSGVAALMISSSSYSQDEAGVKQIVSDLKTSAINLGNAKTYGAGQVNAAAAVKAISIYTKDNSFDVVAGKKLKLLAKTSNGNAKPTWKVDADASVCTIAEKTGVLKAAKTISANTVVTVTATYDGKSASVPVTIWTKAAAITDKPNQKSIKLNYHDTAEFKVKAESDGASVPVTYKTSNNKVAAVDAQGRITALGNGSATVTATAVGGKKATLKVKVTGTPYIIDSIVPVNAKDRDGAEMFAQTYLGSGLRAVPVSEGKSVKYKALAKYPYSTASNKKLVWECITEGAQTERDGVNGDKVSLKNGVLKVQKNLTSEPTLIWVFACPQEQVNGPASIITNEYTCINAAVACKPLAGYDFNSGASGKKIKSSASVEVAKGQTAKVTFSPYIMTSKNNPDTSAVNLHPYFESSDDSVADVVSYRIMPGTDGLYYEVEIEGIGTGSSKITVVSMDGAYKKATINVTVK